MAFFGGPCGNNFVADFVKRTQGRRGYVFNTNDITRARSGFFEEAFLAVFELEDFGVDFVCAVNVLTCKAFATDDAVKLVGFCANITCGVFDRGAGTEFFVKGGRQIINGVFGFELFEAVNNDVADFIEALGAARGDRRNTDDVPAKGGFDRLGDATFVEREGRIAEIGQDVICGELAEFDHGFVHVRVFFGNRHEVCTFRQALIGFTGGLFFVRRKQDLFDGAFFRGLEFRFTLCIGVGNFFVGYGDRRNQVSGT